MKWNGIVTTSLRCIISSSPPHCELKLHLYLGESFGGTARKDTQSNLPNALFRSKDYLLTSKSFIQRQLSSGGIKSHLWCCSDQLSSFSYYFHIIINSYRSYINLTKISSYQHTDSTNIIWSWIKVNNIRHSPQCSIFDVFLWKRFEMNCNLLDLLPDPHFTVNIIHQ